MPTIRSDAFGDRGKSNVVWATRVNLENYTKAHFSTIGKTPRPKPSKEKRNNYRNLINFCLVKCSWEIAENFPHFFYSTEILLAFLKYHNFFQPRSVFQQLKYSLDAFVLRGCNSPGSLYLHLRSYFSNESGILKFKTWTQLVPLKH